MIATINDWIQLGHGINYIRSDDSIVDQLWDGFAFMALAILRIKMPLFRHFGAGITPGISQRRGPSHNLVARTGAGKV